MNNSRPHRLVSVSATASRVLAIAFVLLSLPVNEAKAIEGSIALGTWATQAEFKDIKVTSPDGKILFTSDFAEGPPSGGSNALTQWKLLGQGAAWSVQNGALRQTT